VSVQVLVQVVCSPGGSLREAIARHPKVGEHNLVVTAEKRQGRQHGWAKIHSTLDDRHGAINLHWDGHARILLCRVVTRGSGRPDLIIADFIEFLFACFRKRIQAINIIPRDARRARKKRRR
jgi:hypothetical protein